MSKFKLLTHPKETYNIFHDQCRGMINFAVTSKYFSVYHAYYTELQDMGYSWNSEFNKFDKSMMETRKVVFLCDNWNNEATGPMMSFSNVSNPERAIDLDKDFDYAVRVAKAGYEAWKERTMVSVVLNESYTAIVSKEEIQVGCQTFPKSVIKELFDAAKKAGMLE